MPKGDWFLFHITLLSLSTYVRPSLHLLALPHPFPHSLPRSLSLIPPLSFLPLTCYLVASPISSLLTPLSLLHRASLLPSLNLLSPWVRSGCLTPFLPPYPASSPHPACQRCNTHGALAERLMCWLRLWAHIPKGAWPQLPRTSLGSVTRPFFGVL